MSFFIMFFITILDSVAVAYLTRRSFGRTAAFVNLSLIVILYLAGLGQRLDIGMYVFFALSLGLVGTCIGLSCKRRDFRTYLDIIKNPLFIAYIVFGLAMAIGLINILANDYDEKTHWALVVKNMYTYNNFGNLGDTTTMFNRYVPGISLFLYAFQFFNRTFTDGNLHAAFDILLFSLVLPLPDKFGVKKPVPFLVSLIAPMFLICVFKYAVYFNLRVDAIIGVMGAYLYFVFLADRGHCNWFTITELSLGCFALTLAKTSGIGLAAIAIIFIALDTITRGRKNIKPFFAKKINFALILIPIAALLIAKFSWNAYCDINQVRSGWNASELTMQSLWAYITQPTPFQSVVTARFWRNFFVGTLTWKSGCLNQPFVLYFPCFLFVTILLCRKGYRSFGISMLATSMVVLFIYGIINLLLYIFSFSYYESYRLASYSRYFISIFILVTFVWIGFISDIMLSDVKLDARATRTAWASAAVALALFFVSATTALHIVWTRDAATAKKPFENWIQALSTLEDTDYVYYTATEDYETYFLARYLATPTRCSGYNLGGSYIHGRNDFSYTGDPFTWDKTAQDLADDLAIYDYYFLDKCTPEFVERYGSLFANGDVRAQILYRVEHHPGGVLLVPMDG